MKFEEEMKKYKELSKEDRQKKVINLLEVIKDKNEKLLKTYNLLLNNNSLPLQMIDDIYKTLLEAMVYQQSLDYKKINDNFKKINNSLNLYIEQEKKERLAEAKESENLLNFV